RMAGLLEELREARRLVAGEDDPGAIVRPALDGLRDRRGPGRRELRLAPPERVARAEPARRQGLGIGELGLPGQLQRPAADEAALPLARAEVRRWPVLRQVAALDQLRAALVGLAPEERGGLGDLARLVEDEEGRRIEVVEAGRRGEVGGPDL